MIALRIGGLQFAKTFKMSQFLFTRRDILKCTYLPENPIFILEVGKRNVCLSGRSRIGVVFRRDMSASGRQISTYMALLWPSDRLVEKLQVCGCHTLFPTRTDRISDARIQMWMRNANFFSGPMKTWRKRK